MSDKVEFQLLLTVLFALLENLTNSVTLIIGTSNSVFREHRCPLLRFFSFSSAVTLKIRLKA